MTAEPERRIKRNRIQCALCKDIIESIHRHDFKCCKCGKTFVDGGKSYQHYGSEKLSDVINLVEYEEDKANG